MLIQIHLGIIIFLIITTVISYYLNQKIIAWTAANNKERIGYQQRLHYIKHIDELRKNNAGLELKILPNGVLSDYQHIPRPTYFFQKTLPNLRFEKNTPEYNVCIPNKIVLNKIFKEFFTELWDSDTCVSPDSLITHSILSMEILQSETSNI